jgi:hypothetical protein
MNVKLPNFISAREYKKSVRLLLADFSEFFHLFFPYVQQKLLGVGLNFEGLKRIVVGGLMMKRGRFNRPFCIWGSEASLPLA